MKSTVIAIAWVIIFICFGIYIDKDIQKFTVDYIKDVDSTYELIYDKDWEKAEENLDILTKKLESQKDLWLKVLNHQYYNDIYLELSLIKNALRCKDRAKSLEGIEKIKYILHNIIDDEKCTANYIF